MSLELENYRFYCPYCGESISTLVDCSVAEQQYIEDCQVCCRPINFKIVIHLDGSFQVSTSTDND